MNKVYKNKPSILTIFPSYGIGFDDKRVFSTTNQRTINKKKELKDLDYLDRTHFRQVYDMKIFMDEMLKAKNMRAQKK
jgi:hypothetical protein